MQVVSGTRLGPYELGPLLGQGGMGAVYRARDTRLDRAVAIKVLPPATSADPRLRERLAREARAISALSHPNICALYDVGSVDGIDYLVMELLEGETLASRLTRGPLPQATAVALGVEIALALDAAHRAGLIHRDLKPANVMLTRNGARLLDFGLAKVITTVDSDDVTAAAPMTRDGLVVGTLRYMAPEQLEARTVDARTDIFALGLVLYEMLAGRPAFDATSQASLIAAVLTAEPAPLRTVNADVSPDLERIVHRCLQKNPDDRWQSARDLAEALRWTREPAREPMHVEKRRRIGARLTMIAAVFALAGVLAGHYFTSAGITGATSAQTRFSISPPSGLKFRQTPVETELAVAPDGRAIALIALEGRRRHLFVRFVSDLETRPLDGTDDAAAPFWSPDSKWIGFFAAGALKKVSAMGGPVVTIAPAQGNSGSWNRDGQILYSEWGPNVTEASRVVSENGGAPRDVTDPKPGWSIWPSFAPDGHHFVFLGLYGTDAPALYLGSIDHREIHRLVTSRSRAEVRGEWLYYVRDAVLVRQRIDINRGAISGDPIPVAQPVFCFASLGSANFSVSENGATIVYQRPPLRTQLVWRDWSGHELGRAGQPELYRHFSLSPDGQRIAADIFDPATQVSNISLFDVGRGVWTRVTTSTIGTSAPLWLPDGEELVVTHGDERRPTHAPSLSVLNLRSGVFEPLREGDGVQYGTGFTRDAAQIVYTIDRGRYNEMEMLSMRAPHTIVKLGGGGSWNESDAAVSPDQRWMAYQSDESGRQEIYIRPFGRNGEKLRVSSAGGIEPQWADDKRLLYLTPAGMLTKAEIEAGERPRVRSETPLFRIDSSGMMELDALGVRHYLAVGDRILSREIPGGSDADPVIVLLSGTVASSNAGGSR